MKQYNKNCKMLTDRSSKPLEEYEVIKKGILDFMYEKAKVNVDKIIREGVVVNCSDERAMLTEEEKEYAASTLETIFGSANDNIGDSNIIGFLNIVGFQCSLLFTVLVMNTRGPALWYDGFLLQEFFREDPIDIPFYEVCISKAWMKYTVMKTLLINIVEEEYLLFTLLVQSIEGQEYTIENIENPDIPIYLTKWITQLNLEETILNNLNNVFYCEISSEIKYADAFCIIPYSNLYHDLVHGANYYRSCQSTIDNKHYLEFYQYCKTHLDPDNLRKLKIYMFFQLHEEYNCDIRHSKILTHLERFVPNDLEGLVPEELNTREYLQSCIDVFEKAYKKFQDRGLVKSTCRGCHIMGGTRKRVKHKMRRSKRKRTSNATKPKRYRRNTG